MKIIVSATVTFTEDDWNTSYTGTILETSMYSYLIHSQLYGTHWIAKSNVKVLTPNFEL